MKQLISIRISDATKAKLDELSARHGTQTEAIAVAIDHLYQEKETEMTRRVYTVITTSGWVGDGWSHRGTFDTRAEAEAREKEVARHDATENGYITGIIGGCKVCYDHEACWIGDTSRLHVERHLRHRQMHISDMLNLEP